MGDASGQRGHVSPTISLLNIFIYRRPVAIFVKPLGIFPSIPTLAQDVLDAMLGDSDLREQDHVSNFQFKITRRR